MLGTPCDARAACCQVKSLSCAAAADWGDQEDARMARVEDRCHALHAERCPCHRAKGAFPASDTSREGSADAAPRLGGAGGGFPAVARGFVAACTAFEERAFGSYERSDACLPDLERWYVAVVAGRQALAGGPTASGRCAGDARVAS